MSNLTLTLTSLTLNSQLHVFDRSQYSKRQYSSEYIPVEVQKDTTINEAERLPIEKWFDTFYVPEKPMMNVSHDQTEIFFDEIDLVVIPPSFYSIEEGWLIVFDKLERVFYPFNTSQYQEVQVSSTSFTPCQCYSQWSNYEIQKLVEEKTVLMRGITLDNIAQLSDGTVQTILDMLGIAHQGKTRSTMNQDILAYDPRKLPAGVAEVPKEEHASDLIKLPAGVAEVPKKKLRVHTVLLPPSRIPPALLGRTASRLQHV
jgi:hypothetical protein